MILQGDHFALSNFEGTLDFLICLLQKEEIDIYDIPIQELLQQFTLKIQEMQNNVLDRGAEFIGVASYLVWLKSKMLLPQLSHENLELEESFEDPHFEIIHHLIDYCHFKRAAKVLSQQQIKQQDIYCRGIETFKTKRPLGLDDISIDELSLLFSGLLSKANKVISKIEEEKWLVSDKIDLIRFKLKSASQINLSELFDQNLSRPELIVTFLAILELMKIGSIGVFKSPQTNVLILSKK